MVFQSSQKTGPVCKPEDFSPIPKKFLFECRMNWLNEVRFYFSPEMDGSSSFSMGKQFSTQDSFGFNDEIHITTKSHKIYAQNKENSMYKDGSSLFYVGRK
jgi:hypothetical protein